MKALKIIGYILFFGCGLFLYILSLLFYYALYDLTGLIIGIIVFPAAEIFPIVAWIATKQFPVLLFVLWFSGWAGMIIAGVASKSLGEY